MPYSRVTRAVYGAKAIQYIKGKDKKKRNEYISGINLLPDDVVPFEIQMQSAWDRADRRHIVQVDRFIVSFSKKEVDPDDPVAVARAHQLGCEVADILAHGLDPDNEQHIAFAEKLGIPIKHLERKGVFQAVVATQTDGVGGCVHIHIGLNDVAMDTKKGLNSGLYYHPFLRKIVDYISERYIDLDQPELAPEKETPAVRGLKVKNEKIKKANDEEIEKAEKEGRSPNLQAVEYIWTEDLKARIREAAMVAKTEEGFFEECRVRGVIVIKKRATKKQPEHYTYELIDKTGFDGSERIPRNLKKRSYKLGANYMPEGVCKMSRAKTVEDFINVKIEKDLVQKIEVKSPKELRREIEKQAMEEAEQEAFAIISRMYSDDCGWEDNPELKDENGRIWTDFDELSRRNQLEQESWENFKKWRVKQRKAGIKVSPIYRKDAYGTVFVLRDDLKNQYELFLHQKQRVVEKLLEKKEEIEQLAKEKPQKEERIELSQGVKKRQKDEKMRALVADIIALNEKINSQDKYDMNDFEK